MDGFQKRALNKQNNIRDAAYKLFVKKGLKETSIKAIALEGNVSQVTIYNYFKSKENLFHIVAESVFETYAIFYEDIVYKQNLSFNEKMTKILKYEILVLGEFHNDFFEALFDLSDSRLSKIITHCTEERILPALKVLVDQGKKSKELNPNISNHAVMLYMRMFTQIRDMGINGNKALLNQLLSLFFNGLGGKNYD